MTGYCRVETNPGITQPMFGMRSPTLFPLLELREIPWTDYDSRQGKGQGEGETAGAGNGNTIRWRIGDEIFS